MIAANGEAVFGSASIRGNLSASSIYLGEYNRWGRNSSNTADSSDFQVGNINNYIHWNGSSLEVKGSVTLTGTNIGTFDNGDALTGGSIGGVTINPTKIYIGTGTFNNANTAFYVDNSGQFSLKDKLRWDGSSLTIQGRLQAGDIYIPNASSPVFSVTTTGALTATSAIINGTINATGGTITGFLNAGGVDIGIMRPSSPYYKGINLSPDPATQFQSCFIKGAGNEVFFRADNGSQWIKFEIGEVNIKATNLTISNSGATFTGALSGASGNVGADFTIGNNLTIGNNVRINGAAGDGAKSIVKIRADSESSNSLNHPLLVVNFTNENLFRVRRDGRIDMGKVTTGSTDEEAEVFVNGSLVHGSDVRFKKDISSTILGLNFINRLEPVQYYLKGQTTLYKHEGFIAQDVKKILDSIGVKSSIWKESDEEESYQYLNYQEFIAPLVKAIQELSKKVDELEFRMI